MKLYKIIFIFFIIPTIIVANDKKKHEKSKEINKIFTVNKNATLYINNKYGNINVTTWNQKRVEINVKITVKGNDLKNVDQKLNSINIFFEDSDYQIKALTKIENTKSNWSWWGNNNINYQINYFIKMPITNNADLNNKYGSIELDKIEGKVNIKCDYGDLQIDQLLSNSNTIDLDYCENSEINFIKSGNINIDYSKLVIEKSESININADYSTVKIKNIDELKFNSDYGSISINDVKNISGSSDYAGIKIGTLRKNLNINAEFGGVKIMKILKDFENITIDGSYAGINIGTVSNNNFDFTIDLSYSGFNYPENKIELLKSINNNNKKKYKGIFGKGNTNSNIIVKSRYGGVLLKLND